MYKEVLLVSTHSAIYIFLFFFFFFLQVDPFCQWLFLYRILLLAPMELNLYIWLQEVGEASQQARREEALSLTLSVINSHRTCSEDLQLRSSAHSTVP